MSDIIIVGGGNAGCVLASRLKARKPSLTILLIEAGPDVTHHQHTQTPDGAASLHGSEIDWKYLTVPQSHLDGKPKYNCGVRCLGGATAINSGGWIRGEDLDFDEWAREASDQRWSYDGLLPYFRRTEHHFDANADPTQHGFDGPVHLTSVTHSGRDYPLREKIKRAWEAIGLALNPDANNGHPQGIAEPSENWRDGKRQLANVVYPLEGVQVLTNTLVGRVIFNEENVAVGVELANEAKETHFVKLGGQVILSAGAYRTPQLLLLSGIGDSTQLSQHGVPMTSELPDVGKNLHDHLMYFRYWKLRHPEQGLALGSPLFQSPAYAKGAPGDWLVTTTVPDTGLKAALEKDLNTEASPINNDHPLVKGPRAHLEMSVIYAAFAGESIGLQIPIDGTAIMTYCMGCLPTSRGSVTLGSNSPAALPVIDPNYYATEMDRYVLCEGFRVLSRLMLETPEGKDIVEKEIVPEGHQQLASDASKDAINKRIAIGASTVFHPAGTAAMGKVVDGSLNVKGVKNLRVVDASIIPVPLASHYQVAVYAIAEQAVDIILRESL